MKEKVLRYIQLYQMIQNGDRVLAGLSGGRDSVCLVRMLAEFSKKMKFELAAVHVHHGIRGKEADRDAQFCRKLCEELQIPFFQYDYRVKELAEQEHLSEEEAGRKVRYEAFEKCAQKLRADKIALAHHMNDAAETFLFHLARGSSMTGLGGIRPVRGCVIRPFLCVEREEISDYMRQRNWNYVDDSTNEEEVYTRNRIRRKIIPELEQGVNTRTVEHIANAACEIQEIENYLQRETEKLEERYLNTVENQVTISVQLIEEEEFLAKRVILNGLEYVGKSRRNLGRIHVQAVWELLQKPAGKKRDLPGNICAVREKDIVRLCIGREEEKGGLLEMKLITGERQYLGNYQIYAEEVPGKMELIPEKAYTKWIDYGKIKKNLSLRSRKTGDYICTCKDGGTKKLKDYMIDAGIPREQRDSILLVADGEEIVWIVGYRLSERYKISVETEKVLCIEIQGGITNE